MKKNEIGKVEGKLIIYFSGFCVILGSSIGIIVSVYISCVLTGNPLDMKYFGTHSLDPWGSKLPIIGIVIGAICIGLPLFILFIKPFYTREAIIELINKHGGSVNDSVGSAKAANRLGWFWFDLLYPAKTNGNRNEEN